MFLIPLIVISCCYIKIAKVVWRYDRNPPKGKLNARNYPRKPAKRVSVPNQTAGLSRAKVKTIQVTVCILLSYTFCWIPYFTVALLNVWSNYEYKEAISNNAVGVLAQYLCWFSSCINPIIYGFFNLSNQFRETNSCCLPGRGEPRSLMVGGKLIPYRSGRPAERDRHRRQREILPQPQAYVKEVGHEHKKAWLVHL